MESTAASVVVDLATGAPTIIYWGAPLGPQVDLASIGVALSRPIAHGALDVEAPISVVPEHGSGFPGRPGLAGHRRRGTAWAPRFQPTSHTHVGQTLTVNATDPVAELDLRCVITLDHVLRIQLTLTNASPTERYLVERLDTTLALPAHARELLQFTGRWTRELHPYRQAFSVGAYTAENRRGRTSHDHIPLIFVGTEGFGEWHGEVWGAHLAWSGNNRVLAEVLADDRRYVQLGELLHPGEVSLEPGGSYIAPEVVATYSADGLTPASWGYHRSLRERAAHPVNARPVLLNTWEAVYFDHDTDRLKQLAAAAAEVGVERFVLDDGWFGHRRSDRLGLGDWWVSPVVYPEGLTPLIDYVCSLGMEFGIWVEPEMVNPDSDLYREHPEWALATDGYEPPLGRHQLVLDLGNQAAFDHILGALDDLLGNHRISYVKWDMNRDHVHGSGEKQAAGTHEQTLALYRLLGELRKRHPLVEIESCSSGGARIDHQILQWTQRVWTSDCNDALERQVIQRGASMFIPPELMGAHIGPTRSHTTGRRHSLGFRAATALFGHLGVEWNVLDLTETERNQLAEVIALHKRYRPLLHRGDVVRFDSVDSAGTAHGVYSPDRNEALVCYAQLRTGISLTTAPLRLPGLDPAGTYDIRRVSLPDDLVERGPGRTQPDWLVNGISLTGRQLAQHGLQLPVLNPESAILVHLTKHP
jgi:alpha-galactosidase